MTSSAIRNTNRARGPEQLAAWIERELETLGDELAGCGLGQGLVGAGLEKFLARSGKRLRPRCVLLAAAAGSGVTEEVRDLALAAELVHGATLLHDDVIDESSHRRGAKTVNAALGNSVSILAGDWLLMQGLERVRRAAAPETLAALLAVVSDMIAAESAQLEARRKGAVARASYLRIARQKTAGLFRWSLEAGGRAGGLDLARCRALGRAGLHLGVGFQIADDLSELIGERGAPEEGLYSDLKLGVRSYPLVLALEREPGLQPTLDELIALDDSDSATRICRSVVTTMQALGVVEDTRRAVVRHRRRALEQLSELPRGHAVTLLSAMVRRALPHDA